MRVVGQDRRRRWTSGRRRSTQLLLPWASGSESEAGRRARRRRPLARRRPAAAARGTPARRPRAGTGPARARPGRSPGARRRGSTGRAPGRARASGRRGAGRAAPAPGRAQEADEPGDLHLLGRVAIEPVVPRDHDLGGPPPGPDPQDAELDRQPGRLALGPLDVGVDPPDERPDDRGAAGMVMVQLPGHLAAERQQPGPDVAGQRPGPLDLRHRPGRPPPPELELEQPIAGGVVPLRQEQVVLVPGVDVRDPPAVAHDLHRLAAARGPPAPPRAGGAAIAAIARSPNRAQPAGAEPRPVPVDSSIPTPLSILRKPTIGPV